jgi:hypothetical protein
MMTSTLLDAARNLAVIGSSNAPGTYVAKILEGFTPQFASDSLIP